MRSSPLVCRASALAAAAGLGLAACSGGGSSRTAATGKRVAPPINMQAAPDHANSPAVTTDAVTIKNFGFTPHVVSVKAGTTVTWTNNDDEAHTVYFAYDQSLSSVLVNTNNVYTKTFTSPGTYSYHCTIHPFMTGTVVVTA